MSYNSPVTFIQRLRDEGHPIRVHGHQLPDGDYDGEWSGFNALVTIGEDRYQMATNLGIKGEGIACVVKVENGKVSVSAEERKDDKEEFNPDDVRTLEDRPNRGGWVKKDSPEYRPPRLDEEQA